MKVLPIVMAIMALWELPGSSPSDVVSVGEEPQYLVCHPGNSQRAAIMTGVVASHLAGAGAGATYHHRDNQQRFFSSKSRMPKLKGVGGSADNLAL